MFSVCLHEFEVKGILNGMITELWRPCKIQPPGEGYQISKLMDSTAKEDRRNIDKLRWIKVDDLVITAQNNRYFNCPFGPVGTRIAGKETWCNQWGEDNSRFNDKHFYKADGIEVVDVDTIFKSPWVSPILMPFVASRIILTNAGVECKRVREITESEAFNALGYNPDCENYIFGFFDDWNYLYASKGYSFETAWAWKLKFESEVKR